MALKKLPQCIHPREKALKHGINSLSEVELLALILRSGSKEKNVLELAQIVINKIGGLNNLKDINYEELIKIRGIGQCKALEILALNALYHKINIIKIKHLIYANNPQVIYELFSKKYSNIYQEHFIVLALDSKNGIIEQQAIFIGTQNYSLVHPREIFNFLVLKRAISFICVHNHPSGDALPSNEDIEITKTIIKISKIMQIPLIDHIIIGKDCYYSFKENRMM
ncbi:MAG: DNA repair protein RadC [Bacilli bacterium]|jgi:DNA repair protein RadC|nr:DNA repair protein RadC [Bacilli bacterium]